MKANNRRMMISLEVPELFVKMCIEEQVTPESVLTRFIGDFCNHYTLNSGKFRATGREEARFISNWRQRSHFHFDQADPQSLQSGSDSQHM
jgi:hypothetical protein